MKINKRSLGHWLCLLAFGLNVLCARLRRRVRRGAHKPLVMLYGHKLCGNLLAIYRYWQEHTEAEFDMVFLTMDKAYHRELLDRGVASVLATRLQALRLLSRVDVIISDHGLHVLRWLLGSPGLKFIDVWHGFGFKGHHYDDFHVLRRYDEVWVDSPLQRSFYVEHFGFASERVVATGYARIDSLVQPSEDRVALRRRFGLPDTEKIVLFAPTWQHDAGEQGLFPFGLSRESFYAAMVVLAVRTNSVFVTRAHLNSPIQETTDTPRLRFLPFADHPDTEALLQACDVLLADWSSIVFDWLLLNRPTVFLDVPAPFPVGSTLQPRHRYGHLVADMDELVQALDRYLLRPDAYLELFGAQAALIRREVFGDCADGQATARCFARLEDLINASGQVPTSQV